MTYKLYDDLLHLSSYRYMHCSTQVHEWKFSMLCQVTFTLQKIALVKYHFVTHEPEGTPINFSDFCQQQMFQSFYLQVREKRNRSSRYWFPYFRQTLLCQFFFSWLTITKWRTLISAMRCCWSITEWLNPHCRYHYLDYKKVKSIILTMELASFSNSDSFLGSKLYFIVTS